MTVIAFDFRFPVKEVVCPLIHACNSSLWLYFTQHIRERALTPYPFGCIHVPPWFRWQTGHLYWILYMFERQIGIRVKRLQTRRPVVVAGSGSYIRSVMREAESFRAELKPRGIVVVSIYCCSGMMLFDPQRSCKICEVTGASIRVLSPKMGTYWTGVSGHVWKRHRDSYRIA